MAFDLLFYQLFPCTTTSAQGPVLFIATGPELSLDKSEWYRLVTAVGVAGMEVFYVDVMSSWVAGNPQFQWGAVLGRMALALKEVGT